MDCDGYFKSQAATPGWQLPAHNSQLATPSPQLPAGNFQPTTPTFLHFLGSDLTVSHDMYFTLDLVGTSTDLTNLNPLFAHLTLNTVH